MIKNIIKSNCLFHSFNRLIFLYWKLLYFLFIIILIIAFFTFIKSPSDVNEEPNEVNIFLNSFEDLFNKNKILLNPYENLRPFINNYTKFITFNSTIDECPDFLIYVILVFSSAWNFERRSSVRLTWGNDHSFRKRWKTFFVIGNNEGKQKINNRVNEEIRIYKDIILCNSCIESLEVLPLKLLAGFKWVINRCPSIFLVKVDDDVYINQYKLLEKLCSLNSFSEYWSGKIIDKIDTKGFRGQVLARIPNRMQLGEYCAGAGYIISNDLIYKILMSIDLDNYFHLEDMMVSMILKGRTLKSKLNSIDHSLSLTIDHPLKNTKITCQNDENFKLNELESKFHKDIIIQHPCDTICQIQQYRETLKSLRLF